MSLDCNKVNALSLLDQSVLAIPASGFILSCAAENPICPALCSDCGLPFVNTSFTKTRYPKRALIVFSQQLEWNGHVPGRPDTPDCGQCNCSPHSLAVLAPFNGLFLNNNPSWDYPFLEAVGPFAFGGQSTGGVSKCRGTEVAPLPTCIAGEWSAGEQRCFDATVNPHVSFSYRAYDPVNSTALFTLEDLYGVSIFSVWLPIQARWLDTICKPPEYGVVLPDTVQFAEVFRQLPHFDLGGISGYCQGIIGATVHLFDWVERPFAGSS